MGRRVMILRQYIDDRGLANRDRAVANIRAMIDQGLISEDQAQGLHLALQPLGKETDRRRNRLDCAPELDDIYPDGLPDLVIGELLENPQVPVGHFLFDSTHTLIVGNSGSGKTTAIYNLVLAIKQYNEQHPEDFISIIVWETKDGALLAIAGVIPDCVVLGTNTSLRISLGPESSRIPIAVWNNELGQIISSRGCLRYGAITVTEMLNFLVRAMNNPPSGQDILYPDVENLYELSNMAPKGLFESKVQYQQSGNQVLRQLAHGTGNLFRAAAGGLDLQRDIIAKKRHLVVDARGLSPAWVRAMTSDILLKRLLLGRQLSGATQSGRCWIFWDEADEDVSRKAEENYA